MNNSKVEAKKVSVNRLCTRQGTVRRRCLQFIEVLRRNGYTLEIPLEAAKEMFQTTMGIMDRVSLKSYFGSHAHRSLRKFEQRSTYASGTISLKNIELSQDVPEKKGYFEILGLATFERKGSRWFMILTNDVLVPELSSQHSEGSKCSIVNLSLSHIPQGKECEKTDLQVVSPCSMETVERKNKTTTYRVRDINRSSESVLCITVQPKVKKCLDCGTIDASNPYRVWCPKGQGERTRADVCVLEGEVHNG